MVAERVEVEPVGIIPTRELGPLPRGVDYRRLLVPGEPGETEIRRTLLEAVTVDNRGVAHGVSPNGTETMLAAIRINDAGQASVAPFQLAQGLDREPVVQFALPAGKPSRVGFFLGGDSGWDELRVAIRAGLYPGVPLLTMGETTWPLLGWPPLEDDGYKLGYPLEGQEGIWAEQVGLFKRLGFNPKGSKGIFDRGHRVNPYTSSVDGIKPLSMTARVDSPQEDALQVLFYAYVPHLRHVDTLSLEGAFRVAAAPQTQPTQTSRQFPFLRR